MVCSFSTGRLPLLVHTVAMMFMGISTWMVAGSPPFTYTRPPASFHLNLAHSGSWWISKKSLVKKERGNSGTLKSTGLFTTKLFFLRWRTGIIIAGSPSPRPAPSILRRRNPTARRYSYLTRILTLIRGENLLLRVHAPFWSCHEPTGLSFVLVWILWYRTDRSDLMQTLLKSNSKSSK